MGISYILVVVLAAINIVCGSSVAIRSASLEPIKGDQCKLLDDVIDPCEPLQCIIPKGKQEGNCRPRVTK